MDESGDDSQKTEEPTEKRLRDALEKGQIIYSKEVSNFLIILAFTLIITILSPYLTKQVVASFSGYIGSSYAIPFDEGNIGKVLKEVIIDICKIMIIPFLIIMFMGLISSFLQNGQFVFSFDPISPKLDKLSLLKGFKRIFSLSSALEFIKSVLKITVVGVISYLIIKPELSLLNKIHDYEIIYSFYILLKLVGKMLIGICTILLIIALFDYLFQRNRYFQNLRMSKFEIKEEFKQMEGSPEIKAKLRKIRAERARMRMAAAIPKATVIITNPTHFSVALEYDKELVPTPVVIAKGQDLIALKIRELASKHDIPIVENPPLARSLYSTVEVGEAIPVTYYKAVAEIISYVYRIKNKTN